MPAERRVSLRHQVDHLRIRLYRTKIFFADQCKVSRPTHADYNEILAALVAGVGAIDGNQSGDSISCAERMKDVVKSEGMAVGRPTPRRLPL